jgi:hypothetical protein
MGSLASPLPDTNTISPSHRTAHLNASSSAPVALVIAVFGPHTSRPARTLPASGPRSHTNTTAYLTLPQPLSAFPLLL